MDAEFDGLVFVPLGGAGEIGMNVYLYGYDGRWMMVDLGITFADDRLPGADIVLPDLSFILERQDSLDGIVITHAHEDHLGAVPYFWHKFDCPLYCSPFSAALLRRKLVEGDGHQSSTMRPIEIIKPGDDFTVGPFKCRFSHVTHSIPDASALLIETPLGKLIHSGDWKLDPEPLVGEVTDLAAIGKFAQDGVKALICDSTNVLSSGRSGSEASVRESLTELIKAQTGRVVLTTFASNVARLETAMMAAKAAGREIAVVGRSMRRMIDAARETGYLTNMPTILDERELMSLPRERALLLCTGSQGEPRAALMRIAAGNHQSVSLDPGDVAIFSSKIIPGNERTLYNLHNQLVRNGIEVITEEDHFVHVSGHPCREELEEIYNLVKPEIAIPIHGEDRHLHAHVRFAHALGVHEAPLVANGDLIRLAPGDVEVIDQVHTGRMVLNDQDVIEAGDDLFRTRRRLMHHGTVVVGVVLDGNGSIMCDPAITVLGAIDIDRLDETRDELVEAIADALDDMSDNDVLDDDKVTQTARRVVRTTFELSRQRRPIIEVQISRVDTQPKKRAAGGQR